jgi:hypothetical protein
LQEPMKVLEHDHGRAVRRDQRWQSPQHREGVFGRRGGGVVRVR